ncbi:MAG TPA: sulfatase-like hydrolase/transferase [Chitinophagaceae bacterium]|nr:sulfatase-like hydrolase/transferase [Chitinophagaceae bacterium]
MKKLIPDAASCTAQFAAAFISLLIIASLASCDKAATEQHAIPVTNNNPDTGIANHPIIYPSYKPNIIIILADDLGYEVPQCDGGESYATPNINWLAANGMRFTQCHASPLCSPSRFMLLTGKYNFRNYTAWGIMPPAENTFPQVLRRAGYATCIAGKWQLDGGDNSIHSLGFDDYCVWQPYNQMFPNTPAWSRYKDPSIYINGDYLADSITAGKYSDDFFSQHIIQFMQQNTEQPFFILYSMCLPHAPFYPTPDDADFANFNPRTDASDAKYFPSMIAYMDKKVGEIMSSVQQMGLSGKTIIFFTGDNGTDNRIQSRYNGRLMYGGKGYTFDYGSHVPLMAYWPGVIEPSVNNSLIDFTDFLPTVASLAKTNVPADFGITDGVSFYPQLFGSDSLMRSWVYCYYNPYLPGTNNPVSWIQNETYKLYSYDKFLNIANDVYEHHALNTTSLNQTELAIKQNFQQALDTLR